MAVEREVIVEHRTGDAFEGMRVSWGGIVGGVLVVIGTLLLLTTLGLAIGISAVDPANPNAGALGAGAAIWSAVSLLIALFLGGMAATRMGMVWDRFSGLLQGALVWVISLVAVLYLAANGIGLVVGNAFGLVSSAAQGMGTAITSADEVMNLSAGDVQQIIARLENPETAARISRALGIAESEVQATLQSIRQRVQQVRNDPAQVAAEVRRGAATLLANADERISAAASEVQPEATTSAWVTFIALLLSLAAAVWGAAIGRRKTVARASSTRT